MVALALDNPPEHSRPEAADEPADRGGDRRVNNQYETQKQGDQQQTGARQNQRHRDNEQRRESAEPDEMLAKQPTLRLGEIRRAGDDLTDRVQRSAPSPEQEGAEHHACGDGEAHALERLLTNARLDIVFRVMTPRRRGVLRFTDLLRDAIARLDRSRATGAREIAHQRPQVGLQVFKVGLERIDVVPHIDFLRLRR